MFFRKTTEAAKGKWRGILLELGVPEAALRNRHGPCPMCGGKDRFRWDNKDGTGSFICNACGAGDGMDLAMRVTGLSFAEVASRIDSIIGNIKPDPRGAQTASISDEDRRAMLREVWLASEPVRPGDLVDTYLASRGVDDTVYPAALRFARAIKDGEGGVRPAMIAMIGVPGEKKYASMHRTFLRPDGRGKAEMPAPRKIMPGPIPKGACVQLSEYVPGGPLGVAEGIETALAASALFDMPVWSALNATILAKWTPPEGCREVVVFGDNDPKMGGQAAAYSLAHRLACDGIDVTVKIPDLPGTDWNDVLLSRCGGGKAA